MDRVIFLYLFLVPVISLRIQARKKLNDHTMRDCVSKYAEGLDGVRAGLGSSVRDHPLKAVATSDRPLVIGAGFGTTGTRSLATALAILGLNVKHFETDKDVLKQFRQGRGEAEAQCHEFVRNKDYTKLSKSVDAVLDAPVAENFLNMFLAYPKAKVILTKREGASWQKNRKKHHMALWPIQEPCGMQMFQGEKAKPQEAHRVMELHDELIECVVPEKQLLEFNLFEDPKSRTKSLMKEVAQLVGKPDLGKQFPHSQGKDWTHAFKVVGILEEEQEKCKGPNADKLVKSLFHTQSIFGVMQDAINDGCEIVPAIVPEIKPEIVPESVA